MKQLLFGVLAASILFVGCTDDTQKKPEEVKLDSLILYPHHVGAIKLDHYDIYHPLFGKDKLFDIFTIATSPAGYNAKDAAFTSSDPNVIDINELGRFRITGSGKATVTAALGGKTATCDFDIIKDTVTASGDEYNPKNAVMIYFSQPVFDGLLVDKSVKPTVIVLPDTAESSIQLSSDDPSIAKIDDEGQIVGVVRGTTRVNAHVNAFYGKYYNRIITYATVNVKNK